MNYILRKAKRLSRSQSLTGNAMM